MYKISDYEFFQYKIAEHRLRELKEEHREQLQRAYDGIHPTRTQVDYHLGRIYAESICPAEYAAYLADMQAEHKRIEEYWEVRAKAYSQALEVLSDEELNKLNGYFSCRKTESKVKRSLEKIIASNPILQRDSSVIELFDDVDEYDKKVDSMNEEDLLVDYEDPLERENLKEQCIRLYTINDMTFQQIGETLGITSTEARRIILSSNEPTVQEVARWKEIS